MQLENSKGITDKNLQHINKKSLVQISIEQGLRTCETVILTSDSAEILEVGNEYDDVFIINRDQNLVKRSHPLNYQYLEMLLKFMRIDWVIVQI